MRQTRHVVKSECARSTFNGMGGTEDGVEEFRFGRRTFDAKQIAFHGGEMLGALLQINIPESTEVDGHSVTYPFTAHSFFHKRLFGCHKRTFAMVSSSFCGSNGFTIHPVAPA